MNENNKPSGSRALSLIRTLSSTAVRAGADSLRRKLSSDSQKQIPPDAALRLVQGLDELKGAAMKMGQMLSMVEEADILPEGWAPVLAALQSQATPRAWAHIAPLVEEVFPGFTPFSKIDPDAVHAASIGQVHRAWLQDGSPVALKVRYPDLEKWVASDLAMMKRALLLAKLLPNEEGIDDVMKQVEKIFLQELDFDKERQFYQFYHGHFNGHSKFVVPKAIEACCSPTILTTEWIEGESLTVWMQNHPIEEDTEETKAQRNRIGEQLFELLLIEIHQLKRIQSDPNPANFLIMPSGQLGLLDFGATQMLPPHVVRAYRNIGIASCLGSRETMEQALLEAGFLIESDSAKTRGLFVDFMMIIAEPFQEDQYSWYQCQIIKRVNELSLQVTVATRFRPPPPEVVFLNRRLGGTQLILEKLGSTFSAREIMSRILGL